MQAASLGRSMAAKAREILTQAVALTEKALSLPFSPATPESVCNSVREIWKSRNASLQ